MSGNTEVTYDVPDPWIWTHTGREFHYFDDDNTDQIDIRDITAALSKQCRYNGQIDCHYSVADHCVNLVEHVEETARVAPRVLLGLLLHDAAEAYLPDVPGPVKTYLPDYRALEKRICRRIWRKFDLPTGGHFENWVDYYDKNIVRPEASGLFAKTPTWVGRFVDLKVDLVVHEDWRDAYRRFIGKYNDLQGRISLQRSGDSDDYPSV